MKPTVDIILPCYNPILGWEKNVLQQFQSLQAELKESYLLKLIVVNDGSTNGISEQITLLQNQLNETFSYYEYLDNKGKGYALRHGVSKSVSDYIVYTDIDFPYSQQSLMNVIYSLINNQKDVILTKRNETYYKNSGFVRKYVSKILKIGIRFLIGLDFKDSQAGLKAFNLTGKKIFLSTSINRYLFDLEFANSTIKKKADYEIVEIDLRDNIELSKLNLKILFSESIDFIKLALRSEK